MTQVPSSMRRRGILVFGGLLIVSGLLLNPWTLSRWFSHDQALARGTILLILLADLAVTGAGLSLVLRRGPVIRSIDDLKRMYYGLTSMVFNTLLLFVLANLAVVLLAPSPKELPPNYFTVEEMQASNPGLFTRLYPGVSPAGIRDRLHPPNITSHPTLEFMEQPIASPAYNVGVENMRQNRFVTRENAREKINGATWVFGGSTTFGHGVADDETIVAWLNTLDSGTVYINFAVQAYHQNLEIDKLLLLLQKGYRPSRVIFVDGLNDIAQMNTMFFGAAESPSRLYDAYRYRSNLESVREPDNEFVLRRLPLFNMLLTTMERGKLRALPPVDPSVDEDLDAPDALYHRSPVLHYDRTTAAAADYDAAARNVAAYQRKLVRHFADNTRFLDALSSAFGFSYAVMFQPMGNLSPENPFHRDPARMTQDPRYRYFKPMADTVRAAIAAGILPHYHDISQADRACPDCYVDLTHYGPELCHAVATAILQALRAEGGGTRSSK